MANFCFLTSPRPRNCVRANVLSIIRDGFTLLVYPLFGLINLIVFVNRLFAVGIVVVVFVELLFKISLQCILTG